MSDLRVTDEAVERAAIVAVFGEYTERKRFEWMGLGRGTREHVLDEQRRVLEDFVNTPKKQEARDVLPQREAQGQKS